MHMGYHPARDPEKSTHRQTGRRGHNVARAVIYARYSSHNQRDESIED